jgi:hypothetical protein
MKAFITAVKSRDFEKVRRALPELSLNAPGNKRFNLSGNWLVAHVDKLTRALPGPEIRKNNKMGKNYELRKKVLGALLGEAVMRHLGITGQEREKVRDVIAQRIVSESSDIDESDLAEETMMRVYAKFSELKTQLNGMRTRHRINDAKHYEVWDHASKAAIYFTP